MKILISAYACEPGQGSEPGIGWNWALQAAQYNEVWVLTRTNNRDAIERELAENPRADLQFIYHDLPSWARQWKRGGRGVNLYYFLWQLSALPVVCRAHRRVRFEVTHHVTFGAIRYFSVLCLLPVPFVWGPVGGGESIPRAFVDTFGPRAALEERLRAASFAFIRFDPFLRLMTRKASVILLSTPGSICALPKSTRSKCRVESAMGIEPWTSNALSVATSKRKSVRLLFVGRLVYWKGVRQALQAVAMARERGTSASLTVVGDGPDRNVLEALARDLAIDDVVDFLGGKVRDEALKLYAQHDILLFPSFHDTGGFVVLEAMAARLPVICLNRGGPAIAVTDETGIRVPACNSDQVVHGLASAIARLAAAPALRRLMGETGHNRVVSVYSWQRKGHFLRKLYSEVTGGDQ